MPLCIKWDENYKEKQERPRPISKFKNNINITQQLYHKTKRQNSQPKRVIASYQQHF